MPIRSPLAPPAPRRFSAIPAYYTPATQPPTRPGWYFCRLACGRRYTHLTWKCGSFWDGVIETEVSYWVAVPGFVGRVLETRAESY